MKSAIVLRMPLAGLLTAAFAGAQSNTVNVKVGNQADTTLGVSGRIEVAMSTSFQLAGWSYQYFSGAPQAPAMLTALDPFHTRVQVISDAVPQTGPDSWSFKELDTMLAPIQATGDHSPESQIGPNQESLWQ